MRQVPSSFRGPACPSTSIDNDRETAVGPTQPDQSTRARIAERFGKLPLSFEPNKGQSDPSVKFLARGSGYQLFLTPTDAVLLLQKPRTVPLDKQKLPARPDEKSEPEVREGSVLRLRMLGTNANASIAGEDELPGKVNYLMGNQPDKWRRNIPTYRRVQYKDVYPGVDVVYYGNQRELEYDFVVTAGANPKLIRFRIEGADKIRLDQSGNLQLAFPHGEVRLHKPSLYQVTEQGRREVKGEYVVNGNEIGFKVFGLPDWFITTTDRNTRVMFFTRNLQLNPGELSSAVVVRFFSGNLSFDVPAEEVRPVPNTEFTQVVIRLPNNLPVGTATLQVRAHSRTSNAGTIRIVQ